MLCCVVLCCVVLCCVVLCCVVLCCVMLCYVMLPCYPFRASRMMWKIRTKIISIAFYVVFFVLHQVIAISFNVTIINSKLMLVAYCYFGKFLLVKNTLPPSARFSLKRPLMGVSLTISQFLRSFLPWFYTDTYPGFFTTFIQCLSDKFLYLNFIQETFSISLSAFKRVSVLDPVSKEN